MVSPSACIGRTRRPIFSHSLKQMTNAKWPNPITTIVIEILNSSSGSSQQRRQERECQVHRDATDVRTQAVATDFLHHWCSYYVRFDQRDDSSNSQISQCFHNSPENRTVDDFHRYNFHATEHFGKKSSIFSSRISVGLHLLQFSGTLMSAYSIGSHCFSLPLETSARSAQNMLDFQIGESANRLVLFGDCKMHHKWNWSPFVFHAMRHLQHPNECPSIASRKVILQMPFVECIHQQQALAFLHVDAFQIVHICSPKFMAIGRLPFDVGFLGLSEPVLLQR